MITDRELLGLCLEELRRKLGYPGDQTLSQSDMEHLCYAIDEKTGILISLSTIKRILHGKFERLPQISTLNAITVFLGYEGWQDFKSKHSQVNAGPRSPEEHSPKKSRVLSRPVEFGIVVVFVGVAAFYFFRFVNHKTHSFVSDDIYFSERIVAKEGVPNSVVFSYNIDDIPGDSFFIQPSWNKRQRVRIERNNYAQTIIYFEPGYHQAKLIVNTEIVKEIPVNIPAKNWMGYSKANFFSIYPEYFNDNTVIHDNVLGANQAGLKASGVDFSKDKIYYYAGFPDLPSVDSDNFTFRARIRTQPAQNTLCPFVLSEVYGENAIFYFSVTIPGCVGKVQAMVSDQHVFGETTDLSAFGYDVTEWQEIAITVVNKTARINIGNKQVFERKYTKPAGLIKGMGFGSNGLCEVDYVELLDSAGHTFYRNDFDK